MLNQNLQQKLLQKLSPQQIQLIKLLEVPTIQLEQRIKKEIEENPVLEEGKSDEDEIKFEDDDYDDTDGDLDSSADEQYGDDYEFEEEKETYKADEEFVLSDYIDEEEVPAYKLEINNTSKDDRKSEVPYYEMDSFREHLLAQLGLRTMSDKMRSIAEYIIGNIDDDGYLRRELEDIVDDMTFIQNVSSTMEEVQEALKMIQDFDPSGVASRTLQECLLLQLARKLATQDDENSKYVKLAHDILANFFLEFSKKHYDKIISKFDITDKQMKHAIAEILKLNPKPGGNFSVQLSKVAQHIVPDFILEEHNDELILHLNSKNIPDLKINKTYIEIIENISKDKKNEQKEKDAITFVKQKLDSAKWFIDAIKQRQNTLQITMQAIIDYQRQYFNDGDETMLKPMILKDIAEKTNLDISTISRVANSKYIQTHFGIFPLKFFFSEGMQTDSGEEVSTREIKKILKDCIDNESKKRPLTDERLAKILQDKGYQIARRTVAKYREQMNILVARLRKEL